MSRAMRAILAGKNLTRGIHMDYEVIRDRRNSYDWRVEAIDFANEGQCYVTIFSGPDAKARANEYARWKSGGS